MIKKIIYPALIIAWVLNEAFIMEALTLLFGKSAQLIQRDSLLNLTLQHLLLVMIAFVSALFLSLVLAFLSLKSKSNELKTLILNFSAFAQSIPSAVVMALSIPLLGYGNAPILFALILYAILPILRAILVGLDSSPIQLVEAAYGLGLSEAQVYQELKFPLAMPSILAGIKTALIVLISAATLGATVGAGGLGVWIIAGIRSRNYVLVILSSVPILLMAVWVDQIFSVKNQIELENIAR